jgi:hypothetical protein
MKNERCVKELYIMNQLGNKMKVIEGKLLQDEEEGYLVDFEESKDEYIVNTPLF